MKRPRSVVADVRGTNGHRDRTLEVGLLVVCATVPESRCYPTTAQRLLMMALPSSSAPSRSTEPGSPSTSASSPLTAPSSTGDLYRLEDAARSKGVSYRAVGQASARQVVGLFAASRESSRRGRSGIVAPTAAALALWPPLQSSMERIRGRLCDYQLPFGPVLSAAMSASVVPVLAPSRVDSRSGDHRRSIRGAAWESAREPVLPWDQVPSRR